MLVPPRGASHELQRLRLDPGHWRHRMVERPKTEKGGGVPRRTMGSTSTSWDFPPEFDNASVGVITGMVSMVSLGVSALFACTS